MTMASDVQETPFVKQLAANGTSKSSLSVEELVGYTLLVWGLSFE